VRAALVPSVLAAIVLALVGVGSASAGSAACATAVITDWTDGRIDRVYAVPCYRQALRQLPLDLELYSSAPDDIQQALAHRIASTREARNLASSSNGPAVAAVVHSSGPPAQLLVMGVLAIGVVTVAGACAARRLRLRRR
jgi:hypothetical protein